VVALFLFFFLLVLLPILFGQLLLASLAKLHLSPEAAVAVLLAIVCGALFNIPVKRIVRHSETEVHPFAIFGLPYYLPYRRRTSRVTIIAVNVGGCLVPLGLAVYELILLASRGWDVLAATAGAVVASTVVCYFVARPLPGVGIVLPGLVPPFVAAAAALAFAPEAAAPVAFVAGVAGPLIGADLLHLKDVIRLGAGMASIGGAGTFDGIVLSGIVAAYLA
jgi:uncharacterized membrane protein